MADEPLRLFLVAGEPSGDALGAALIRGLRATSARPLALSGVGGPLMAREGMPSLFPQDDLAVMGIVEVVPRLPTILRRMRETVAACRAAAPAALITIDSPSFGLRVAARLRAAEPAIRTVHYVAPSVWAWRPGRAKRIAAHVDHLLALLPFEPPWFTPHGITCDFVGHPAAAAPQATPEAVAAFRAAQGAGPETPLLCVLPGSRRGEVARHLAPFGETVRLLVARRPGLRVVIPTLAGVAEAVRAGVADWAAPVTVLDPDAPDAAAEKRAAFAAADAALAASGTVALELAAAGTPMVTAYRASPLTAAIVRRLVSVDTANLVNLVAGEKVAPEFLQERLVPGDVAEALDALLADGPERARKRAAAARVIAALGGEGPPPELRAARSVLGAIGAPQIGEESPCPPTGSPM